MKSRYLFITVLTVFSLFLAISLIHFRSSSTIQISEDQSGRSVKSDRENDEGASSVTENSITLTSEALANKKGASIKPSALESVQESLLPQALDLTKIKKSGSNQPPELRVPNPDFLEAFFNQSEGDEVEIPFSDSFVFVGKVLWVMSQQGTGVKALAAANETSALHLERYDRGHYGGNVVHKNSTLAHQLTPQDDGSLLITQILYSDMICARKGATPGNGDGLPPAPEVGNVSQAGNLGAQLSSAAAQGNPTPRLPSGPMAAPPPVFDSRPSARAVIYLDFDGQIVTGTRWNTANSVPTINAAASGLTTADIQQVCEIISEDFSSFDVSVTTNESRYTRAPEDSRIRVIVTPTRAWYPRSVGGVAYLNTFTSPGDTPCWVFESSVGNPITGVSTAASHEVGHTLGLNHDGLTPDEEYYDGVDTPLTSWAPIMGAGYFSTYTQWSKGEYLNASNTEDDLAIITTKNNFGYRLDDKANTSVGARPMPTVQTVAGIRTVGDSGVIGTNTDIDMMTFKAGSGPLNLTIRPLAVRPNLFIKAEILNKAGTVILTGVSTKNSPPVILATNLNAGDYFLKIQGIGMPAPAGNPPFPYDISGYGSIGQYWVNGTFTAPVSIISVSPTSLTQVVSEGINGGKQSFQIAKQGKETTVNYSVETDVSWLSASLAGGTIVGVGNANISIQFKSGALAPGTYTGGITVTGPDAVGSPATVAVSLTINAAGVKIASPTGLSASDGDYRDRIYVAWNNVSGATHYDVYRANSNNRNAASLVDTTTSTFLYDSNVDSSKYYYWIRARNASSKGVSDLIGPDLGYCGISSTSVGNDSFARSIPLFGKSRDSLSGYNFAATSEPNEPRHAGALGGHSVWANWTAPTDGTLTVDTEYSDFDTVLAIYTGSSLTSLKRVASNDDIEGALNRASRVTIRTRARTTYRIAVDGKKGATGDYTLNLRFTDYSKSPRLRVSRASHRRARLTWSSSGYETKYQIQGQYPKSKKWRRIRTVSTYPRSLIVSNLKKKGVYRFRVIPFQWNVQATKPGVPSKIRY